MEPELRRSSRKNVGVISWTSSTSGLFQNKSSSPPSPQRVQRVNMKSLFAPLPSGKTGPSKSSLNPEGIYDIFLLLSIHRLGAFLTKMDSKP
jgi:hypothetical protein